MGAAVLLLVVAVALQLALVAAGTENAIFRFRTFPKSQTKLTAKQQLNLKPKIDIRNAKAIQQPINSGKLSNTIEKQIVNGADATLGQFPWQAYIYIDNAFLCGGSLILENFILTAGHCVDGASFKVVLGSINRQTNSNGHVVLTTTQKIPHENYNDNTLNNDIALLKLSTMVTLTDNIKTVKLPPASDASKTFQGQATTVSGFGRISDSGSASNTLKYIPSTVISNTACAQFYGTTYVISSTLCTQQSSQATCQGDSGGPLVYKDASNAWVQIGVVSYGSSQSCVIGPSGFARVSSFLGWIESKVNPGGLTSTSPTTTVPSTTNASSSPSTTPNAPTTAPSTTTTARPSINCAGQKFETVRTQCCKSKPKDVVVLKNKEKLCGATANSLKAFNVYSMHLQQNMNAGNTVDFNDTNVQQKLASAACFVECFLKGRGVITDGVLDEDKLVTLLAGNNKSPWNVKIQGAALECIALYEDVSINSFTSAGQSCDGKGLIIAQCVQLRINLLCDAAKSTTKTCKTLYGNFLTCASTLFAQRA